MFEHQRGQKPKSSRQAPGWQSLIRPPQDDGQGLIAIGDALAYREAQRKAQFSEAPGAERPSAFVGIGNTLKGLFGLGASRSGLT